MKNEDNIDNYPFKLHEAHACNEPVIASEKKSMAEIIKDGENGYAPEAGSSERLGKILKCLIDNPQEFNFLKAKIRHQMIPTIEQEVYACKRIYKAAITVTG